MPRSQRRLFTAVAFGSVIALGAAIGSGVTTVAYRDIDAMWFTITGTVLAAVLGLICAVIYLHEETRKRCNALHDETRKHISELHDETRQYIESAADRLVKRISSKVTLDLYVALGETIKEQLAAADRLGEATTRWQQITHGDADTPLIDLHRWKANTGVDRDAPRRHGAADSPAS